MTTKAMGTDSDKVGGVLPPVGVGQLLKGTGWPRLPSISTTTSFDLLPLSSPANSGEMVQRVTLRTRKSYNTSSNLRRIIKTPGGKLAYLRLHKQATAPKCGDCHMGLPGVPALRPVRYATVSKRVKTVQRPYGGSRCGNCVRDRIVRAFLVEEAKIVKKVLKSQAVPTKSKK
ncbi:hypothetical protein MJO29_000006 [Puccinia striiformis f. sp. tritici]|nr:uncharacterized protein Pst134EA_032988 [Puccinia striiformis f. sp. tritici]KAH9440833.1 hypothetical protein Pst134EA_032988 [Puccinia striiformis f. sp. tritici]KAI7966729.1 hypothetical protein MJO29_000006 [Puccinia striiformis f. sp. tritici]